VQAQVQAEEAQRLREQAEADAAARQQPQDLVESVGADEAAKLKAAREKEAALAKQEAELMSAGGAPVKASAGKARKAAKTPVKAAPKKKKKKSKQRLAGRRSEVATGVRTAARNPPKPLAGPRRQE
jgi:hypothetical protein